MMQTQHNYFVPDIGNFYDTFGLIFESHLSTFGLLIASTPYFTIIPTISYFQKVLELVAKDEKIAKTVDPLKTNLMLCMLVNSIH
jgi:hypothetical protein